ncbi:recombinase family protein [Streptomyces sp. NBC_01386]|uniref:recombinase family protein n=1 Tax=Streptomyces sp. NBC_01386 TaxID=2903848 RepID=UPI00386F9471
MTVTRLDRLFHSVQNLIIVGIELRGRGIHIQAVTQNVDSNTPEGRDLMPPWQIVKTSPQRASPRRDSQASYYSVVRPFSSHRVRW